ncbi:Glucosamine-6-phosphate deaminase 1 [Paraliobacillus sp. PM-2]|uniref:glucosamine-6-phosphate deaminase n=1 Tax=Paraliobacillus sp. PM-2 TaxID=1462524 RepID=UPI00061C1EF4|nr:glucosamine-6-phosphate deaminase [Paraliobacillus sp. PM-2]CQR46364.1 Glucosamine-6-phosphate deaminase 1 [Paraliobacillus sp. PM-2]
MDFIIVDNYEEMSKSAAAIFVENVNKKPDTVLGLATGSTPERFYELLINEYKENNVSFENVTSFNLDEYVGISPKNSQSYHYYMNEKLFNHINLPSEQAHLPEGKTDHLQEACEEYEQKINTAGGIDLQLLGIGLNGHIGFNEPGTSFDQETHVVDLAPSTREANARFFDSIDEVPTKAITMGIKTIMQSKQIVLLISGEKKADCLYQLVNDPVSEDFPASILNQHPNVTIIADKAAASKINK